MGESDLGAFADCQVPSAVPHAESSPPAVAGDATVAAEARRGSSVRAGWAASEAGSISFRMDSNPGPPYALAELLPPFMQVLLARALRNLAAWWVALHGSGRGGEESPGAGIDADTARKLQQVSPVHLMADEDASRWVCGHQLQEIVLRRVVLNYTASSSCW